MSWELFLAERTFHQVMPVYGMARDPPPHSLSFKAMVMGDLDYAIGVFNAYVDMSKGNLVGGQHC